MPYALACYIVCHELQTIQVHPELIMPSWLSVYVNLSNVYALKKNSFSVSSNLLLQWLSPLKFFITQISLFRVHANLSFKLVPPHNQCYLVLPCLWAYKLQFHRWPFLMPLYHIEDVPLAPTPQKKRHAQVSNLQRCECDLIGNRAFADTVKDPEVEIMDLEWTQWPVPL